MLSPPDLLSNGLIKFLDGFVFFRVSYFDYSDLQLFAVFTFVFTRLVASALAKMPRYKKT